jgi:hypothetical protein
MGKEKLTFFELESGRISGYVWTFLRKEEFLTLAGK